MDKKFVFDSDNDLDNAKRLFEYIGALRTLATQQKEFLDGVWHEEHCLYNTTLKCNCRPIVIFAIPFSMPEKGKYFLHLLHYG